MEQDEAEIIYSIALTKIIPFNAADALRIYVTLGNATAVYENRTCIGDVIEDCSPKLVGMLSDWDEPLRQAEKEMAFIRKYDISAIPFCSERYPQRLKECVDAPVIVFYKGTTELNCLHAVSVVGTRKSTVYSDDLLHNFFIDMKALCPDVLVVSGLAYGVDVTAHKEALDNGMDTVAVLAHGLDTIYPSIHRDIANRMVRQGGLLTEYTSGTTAEKMNFVRRNRIIAGLTDATVVVESAEKGGALITAGIAGSYGRDVFAFPGDVTRPYSQGCNNLIRDNKAALITSADDFVKAMRWEGYAALREAKEKGVEVSLFPSLDEEEQKIVKALEEINDLQINTIVVRTGIPVGKLSAKLLSLEMKGVTRSLAGGVYHLISRK